MSSTGYKNFSTQEQARNAAIRWLENLGARFGVHTCVHFCGLKSSTFDGVETGVEANWSRSGPWWRLRIDYDPTRGMHYNAEFDKGSRSKKMHFCFPGDIALAERLAGRRRGKRTRDRRGRS